MSEGGLIPKAEWKVGDTAFCIPLDKGYAYVNRAMAERYGLDFLSKINGSGVTEVTVVDE
jgi:hypothetical protein